MDQEQNLFDVTPFTGAHVEKRFRATDIPIWTRNKAQFIARYVKTFTYVTKHGTYLDLFAGPQHEESSEVSWAAKLVMENEPARIRNYYLFDKEGQQIEHLEGLKKQYLLRDSKTRKHKIHVVSGDCNQTLPASLKGHPIREREASFCLLDQRSTECDWETVKCVANHKGFNGGNKIELFYFLAQGWIDRTIKSWRKDVEERCERWWGRPGVYDFLKLNSHERGRFMAERFKSEFGYAYSYPFPIQQEGVQGRIMFWMIHASDHPRAPDLMWQAYRHIGAGGGLNDNVATEVELPFT